MENIGVYLDIKSEKYNIHIPMERRITYLRGDSAVGKTALVEYVRMAIEDMDDSIILSKPDEYGIDILTSLSSTLDIESKRNAILLVDDNLATEGVNFSNAVCNYLIKNDLYLLIINRVDILSDINTRKSFDYAVNSILWVDIAEDGVTRLVHPISDKYKPIHIDRADYILGEDRYGITEFCSFYNTCTVVDNTFPKSKDNILHILSELDFSSYKNILLFVDLASFGKYFGDLLTLSESVTSNIMTDMGYECFKYMILSSNLFKDKWHISADVNDYVSWEKYFEIKLEELAKNILFKRYMHGRGSPQCLLLSCNDCDICSHCNKRMDGYDDKLVDLFKGTCFEYLITVLRGYI